MCINKKIPMQALSKREYKNMRAGIGWKVFWNGKEGLQAEIARNLDRPYKRGTWIKATCMWIGTVTCRRRGKRSYYDYVSGFHVFLSKKYAIKWSAGNPHLVVEKVRFRKIHTIGEQSLLGGKEVPVVVAEEMYIPWCKKNTLCIVSCLNTWCQQETIHSGWPWCKKNCR
jgi:hypothetical protein